MAKRCMTTQSQKTSSPPHSHQRLNYSTFVMSNVIIVHLIDSVLNLKGNPPKSLFLVNGYVATKTVDERFVQNYMNNLE